MSELKSPFKDTTNKKSKIPGTPNPKITEVGTHTATPKPRGAVSRVKADAPKSAAKTRRRSNSSPVAISTALVHTIEHWDRERLVKELLARETRASNAELDVKAWEERYQKLQQEGQELYVQFVTHSQRNQRLATDLAESRQELTAAQQVSEERKKKILFLEDEVAELRSSDILLEDPGVVARETDLKESNRKLEEELAFLKVALNEEQGVVARLKLEILALQDEARVVEQLPPPSPAGTDGSSRRVESLMIRNEALRTQNNNLEEKLSHEIRARHQLEADVNNLEQEMHNKDEEHQSALEFHEMELRAANAQHQEDVNRLEEAFVRKQQEYLAQVSRMEVTIQDQARRLGEVSADKTSLERSHTHLEERIVELEEEVKHLVEVAERYRKSEEALESDLHVVHATHKQELEQLDRKYQRKDYKRRYTIARAALKESEDRLLMAMETFKLIESFNAKSDCLTDIMGANVGYLSGLEQEIKCRAEVITMLEKDVREREERLTDKNLVVTEQGTSIKKLNEKVAQLEADRENLISVLKAQEQTIAADASRVEALETSLRDARIELQASLITNNAVAEGQIEMYKEVLVAVNQKLAASETLVEALRNHVAEAEDLIAKKEAELEEKEFVHEEELMNAQAERDSLAERVTTLTEMTDRWAPIIQRQTGAIHELNAKCRELSGVLDIARGERDEALDRAEKLHTQLIQVISISKGSDRAHRAQFECLTQRRQQLKFEVANLKEQFASQNKSLQRELDSKAAHIRSLSEELEEVHRHDQEKMLTLQHKLDAAAQNTELASLRDRLRVAEAALTETERRLQVEKASAVEAAVSKTEMEVRQIAEEQGQRYQDAVQELKGRRQELEGKIQELEKRNAEIELALKANTAGTQTPSSMPEFPAWVEGSTKPILVLWKEHMKQFNTLREESDARTALERATAQTMSVRAEEAESELRAESEKSHQLSFQLQRALLVQQQLLLQLEVLLGIHKKKMSDYAAHLTPQQSELLNDATVLREEKFNLERKVKVSIEQIRELEDRLRLLAEDRDSVREQFEQVQSEWQERFRRVNDDTWKAMARQQRQLWVQFEAAHGAFEKVGE